ncbi:MAG: hypothetical protein ACLSAM_09925 [Alistipes onderdonkii]
MGVPEKTRLRGGDTGIHPQRPPVVMVDTFYGIDERGAHAAG